MLWNPLIFFGVCLMKITTTFASRFTGCLEKIKDQPLKTDCYLFVAIVLIGSILYHFSYLSQVVHHAPVDFLNPGSMIVLALMTGFLFLCNGIIFLFILSLIEHFFVLFIKRKPDFEKTMKSVIYASALPVLFLWIPSVFQIPFSVLALIGAFMIITFYEIRLFHEVTVDRAAFVALFMSGCIIIVLHAAHVTLLG